jgi:hypothetical protein
MGFVPSSSTIQLYAYFTQSAREKIFNDEKNNFTVTYFTLHDNDVNYYLSSKPTTTTPYNTLPSGFIPDVTGDSDTCIKSLASGRYLKNNMLTGSSIVTVPIPPDVINPPIVVNPPTTTVPTYKITPNKLEIAERAISVEGRTVIFIVETTDIPDNTVLYWENIGTTSPSDFIDNTNTGTVTITNGSGTITRILGGDFIKEIGAETIKIQLSNIVQTVKISVDVMVYELI